MGFTYPTPPNLGGILKGSCGVLDSIFSRSGYQGLGSEGFKSIRDLQIDGVWTFDCGTQTVPIVNRAKRLHITYVDG